MISNEKSVANLGLIKENYY